MKYAILFAIFALVAPIYGQSEDSLEPKKHDKRGILGLGHGGLGLGGHGLLSSGLVLDHGITTISHAPIVSHAVAAPVLHAPIALGHSIGLGHGLSLGHGLGLGIGGLHGW